ncbi:MAG: thioredoxin family protein [Nannocystaceae bacterium]|nr:thioredoxin family protein [Nannocystaceae bacterium]
MLSACLTLSACMGPSGGEGPRKQTPAPSKVADDAPEIELATAPALGWGEHIAWRHLGEGLAEAKSSGRPVMLVVHASWCGQCKRLKPVFQDKELSELTRHFVMVNADQDEVPQTRQYAPDGAYLPRVVFLAPETGEVDPSLSNPRRGKDRHYYGPTDDLVGTMRKALAIHGKS